MRNSSAVALIASVVTVGCATGPQVPQEPALSVQLRGTAVEVQNFIEERLRKNSAPLRVDSATDRAVVFKGDCLNMPGMSAFSCAAVMMAVGNSRWDGPFAVWTFRTSEIRGVVNLTGTAEWCATNAFGKTNCMPSGSVNEMNEALRKIKGAYDSEVRPL